MEQLYPFAVDEHKKPNYVIYQNEERKEGKICYKWNTVQQVF
jgi:hypothetical protein